MRPDLRRVTLCCIDCVNHELALAALGQCVQKCDFGRVLFVTDRPIEAPGLDVHVIPPLRSRDDYSRFVVKELGPLIGTDFVLLVQWDGFVINPEAWGADFLDWDYLGARWGWITDGHAVGNGGFSLRSRKLLVALADPHVVDYATEDTAICRTYRPWLEAAHGIRFAPDDVADRFAFEATYPKGLPFGFHGLFNFWLFFREADLAAFLGMASPAILGSLQCMQLARNYADLNRWSEAGRVVRRILEAHPAHPEALQLAASLHAASATSASMSAPASTPVPASTALPASTPAVASRAAPATATPPGRNDPCPCGSGKRYKACHGAL